MNSTLYTTVPPKVRHVADSLGTIHGDTLNYMIDAGLPMSYIAAAAGVPTAAFTALLAGPDLSNERPFNWAGMSPDSGVSPTQNINVTTAKVAWGGLEGGYTFGSAVWLK